MSTEKTAIRVGPLNVEILRKNIKNLHIGVYPPDGRVRVSAPSAMSDESISLAIFAKLAWIRRQREKFGNQPRLTAREAVTGESHYLFGRRYRLCVVEAKGRPQVVLRNKTIMELHIRSDASPMERLAVLDQWCRKQLRSAAGPLIEKWQDTLGVQVDFWGIKRMKTKWGSCNQQTSRVWLNSELAKKPLSCIEYIIVHELAHLLEPNHGDRFICLMDEHLPDWCQRRDLLNSSFLAHESWSN